ncbi:MAG: retropepsin-like aspartic protease [Pseudomonadota bacterium]
MHRWILLIATAALTGTALAHDFTHRVPMTVHASGNVYVTARFESGPATELLVDTGSGFVALSRQTFAPLRDLESTVFVRRMHATMAGGRTTTLPVYRIASLTLGKDCVVRDVEVAVLPGRSANILGLSALRQVQPFAVDLDAPTLFLSHCDIPPSP